MAKITVQNTDITVLSYNEHDYISLTDMANAKRARAVQPTLLRIDTQQIYHRISRYLGNDS